MWFWTLESFSSFNTQILVEKYPMAQLQDIRSPSELISWQPVWLINVHKITSQNIPTTNNQNSQEKLVRDGKAFSWILGDVVLEHILFSLLLCWGWLPPRFAVWKRFRTTYLWVMQHTLHLRETLLTRRVGKDPIPWMGMAYLPSMVHFYGFHEGKYTSHMDGMGIIQLKCIEMYQTKTFS